MLVRRRDLAAGGAAATLVPMLEAWKPALRKVCGLANSRDAAHAVRSGANAIGMVFYPGSPRAVTAEQAAEISLAVPTGVRRVGVFVDERPETIARVSSQAHLNVIQLHGDERPEDCETVRDALGHGVEVWKAVRIGPAFDGAGLGAYRVDGFLLDTACGTAYGGTGESFPWRLARHAKPYGRIILAGGLDGANVAEAARVATPWGVDSSSRLERRPGIKDPEKVAGFLRAVL